MDFSEAAKRRTHSAKVSERPCERNSILATPLPPSQRVSDGNRVDVSGREHLSHFKKSLVTGVFVLLAWWHTANRLVVLILVVIVFGAEKIVILTAHRNYLKPIMYTADSDSALASANTCNNIRDSSLFESEARTRLSLVLSRLDKAKSQGACDSFDAVLSREEKTRPDRPILVVHELDALSVFRSNRVPIRVKRRQNKLSDDFRGGQTSVLRARYETQTSDPERLDSGGT